MKFVVDAGVGELAGDRPPTPRRPRSRGAATKKIRPIRPPHRRAARGGPTAGQRGLVELDLAVRSDARRMTRSSSSMRWAFLRLAQVSP